MNLAWFDLLDDHPDFVFQGLIHWKDFFANHKKYKKVGKVMHPPIDPASPIPEHCQPEKAAKEKAEDEAKAKEESQSKPIDSDATHEEL